jgi:hypothetical protein
MTKGNTFHLSLWMLITLVAGLLTTYVTNKDYSSTIGMVLYAYSMLLIWEWGRPYDSTN